MRAQYLSTFSIYFLLMCLLARVPWVCLLAPDDKQGSGFDSNPGQVQLSQSKRTPGQNINPKSRRVVVHHSEFRWPLKQLPSSFEVAARRKWSKLQQPQLQHPPGRFISYSFCTPRTTHGCGPYDESDKPPTQNRPQNPTIASLRLAGRLTQHGVCVIFECKTRGK